MLKLEPCRSRFEVVLMRPTTLSLVQLRTNRPLFMELSVVGGVEDLVDQVVSLVVSRVCCDRIHYAVCHAEQDTVKGLRDTPR